MVFAECTGLEATMEPKVIKEGGRNYGAAQRPGGVTFATVVLKRGVSTDRSMWQIFNADQLRTVCAASAGNHHSARRKNEIRNGLAACSRDAGEVQIRGSERQGNGGRHRGTALRSRRPFRGLREISMSQPNSNNQAAPTVVKATLEGAAQRRTPMPVHFNPASLVYTVENSNPQQGGRSEATPICRAIHGQADHGSAIRHYRHGGRMCGQFTTPIALFMQSSGRGEQRRAAAQKQRD